MRPRRGPRARVVDVTLNLGRIGGSRWKQTSRLENTTHTPTKLATFPDATVPGSQHDVDFMVKDSKRFADSGGWGWAVFEYDPGAKTFRPGTTADKPPQDHDAKCGFSCHTAVQTRDFVFTEYPMR
jgi:hypothetical protein